jgi:hypothetical protein
VPGAAFREAGDDLGAFLKVEGARSSAGDIRYIARNFLLDEGVSHSRREEYVDSVKTPATAPWNVEHDSYLERAVAWRAAAPPARVDESDPSCPATFRTGLLSDTYGGVGEDLDLLRVTTPYRLAKDARVRVADVLAMLARPSALDRILDTASRAPMRLPDFVGLWGDVMDLFPPGSTPPGNWPDQLRNRLGLQHYSARGQALEILVFRFSVTRVPRLRHATGRRALTTPTVLDARLFAAFCPAPVDSDAGRIVDLTPGSPDRPCRELLHPPVRLRAGDLVARGSITSAGPPLTPARRDHLLWLRLETGRDDYAAETDADIL